MRLLELLFCGKLPPGIRCASIRFSPLPRALMTLIFLPTLFLPYSVPSANAKMVVREQVKYYRVSGKTGRQVHSKFGRLGPRWMRLQHGIAGTQRVYDFKNIKFVKRGRKCVLSSVDIDLLITYYYPKWVNKSSASKSAQKLWKRLQRELIRHEKTHGKFFKETMRLIEKELLKITGRYSNGCRGMAITVKRKLAKINKIGDAKHTAFDRREQSASAKIRKVEHAFIKAK